MDRKQELYWYMMAGPFSDRRIIALINGAFVPLKLPLSRVIRGFEGRVVELSWYGEKPVTLDLGSSIDGCPGSGPGDAEQIEWQPGVVLEEVEDALMKYAWHTRGLGPRTSSFHLFL